MRWMRCLRRDLNMQHACRKISLCDSPWHNHTSPPSCCINASYIHQTICYHVVHSHGSQLQVIAKYWGGCAVEGLLALWKPGAKVFSGLLGVQPRIIHSIHIHTQGGPIMKKILRPDRQRFCSYVEPKPLPTLPF